MLDLITYDVFTETPFLGNPLAIVPQAEGLTTSQMQAIARELNLSETIFVMRPDNPAYKAKVRIFFPKAEIPFAGHPWSAPIEWSGTNVIAWSASGLSG